jgi:hypothetical protein
MHNYKRHQKRMRRRRHLLSWFDRRTWLHGKRVALDFVDDDGLRERICFDRAYLNTWAVPA